MKLKFKNLLIGFFLPINNYYTVCKIKVLQNDKIIKTKIKKHYTLECCKLLGFKG
jgi:hypothetical protein